ncbi:hypothetical protein UPYG_G00191080 [Umbra pygmaea]|uniref:trypsin n=1 Tax=Umbra pygmaea TaxID=75934 RepID=A0ABD0WT54_UMBPY
MALLENFNNQLVCGGWLIDKSWVLTAARCLVWGFPWHRDIRMVYLGVHSLKKATKGSIQSIKVKKNFPHPEYNAKTNKHNIMLLQLKSSVKLTKTVNIKALPNPVTDMPAGTRCLVAGWGRTAKGGDPSDVLLSGNVTLIDRKICSRDYNDNPIITNEMLCAGHNNDSPPVDSCKGDSGGPLVCGGEIWGVVSFGEGCGNMKYPGVYTFISKYDKWIKETITTAK